MTCSKRGCRNEATFIREKEGEEASRVFCDSHASKEDDFGKISADTVWFHFKSSPKRHAKLK
jgi:hypothetical protein